MAFPSTPLPLRNEMLLSGAWVEVTDHTFTRQAIEITRGIPNEAYRADPASVTFQLNNLDGRFTTRNPSGPYYGQLGRNVPHRCVLTVDSDDFSDTDTNGWGVSAGGVTWTNSGGDNADYASGSGVATVEVDTLNSQRLTLLGVGMVDGEVYSTAAIGQLMTGGTGQMELLLRVQDASNFYEAAIQFLNIGGSDVTSMSIARRDAGTPTVLGGLSTGFFYTASTVLGMRFKIAGRMLAFKVWDASGDEPGEWTIHATDNSTSAILTGGDIGSRTYLGSTVSNTLPLTVTYGAFDIVDYRIASEVTSLPTRWDVSGNDVWTNAQAAGILRRLGQGGEPSLSAMYRSTSGINSDDLVPIAYWPMEDGSDATQFAASDSTVSPGTYNATGISADGTVVLASDSDLRGSLPVPVFDEGATADFVFPGYIDAGIWGVQAAAKLATSGVCSATVIMDSGYRIVVTATASTTTLAITIYDPDLSSVSTGSDTFTSADLDVFRLLVIAMDDSSPTDVVTARLIDENGDESCLASATATGLYSLARHGQLSSATSSPTVSFGHYGLFADANFSPGTSPLDSAYAMQGYNGEQAATRVTRACRERGQAVFVITGGKDSTPMGPQQPGTFLDILDACALADVGLLHEARDELALVYQTGRSRYNRDATIALTYGTAGHVAPPLEPEPDDFTVVNDLEIKRRGGSSARFQLQTGVLSIQPWPDGVGRYDRQRTLDLYADSQCADRASWEVYASTVDEERYPRIPLSLAAMANAGATTVYTAAQRLDIGDRLTVASPPAWLPPNTIDQMALSIVETISGAGYLWDVVPQCIPTGVWGQVGTYGDGTETSVVIPRYGLSGATLDAEFDPTSDTSFDVDYGVVQLRAKTYSPPLQLDVGGYIILATTVGSPTGTVQTVSGLTIPSYATTTKPATTTVRLGPDQRARYGL